ncbi:hypothetical protein NDU88_005603 [Pleurodeles waltl]|uniref:Uncharacterized protein n=1 Tax=Pleurodeles waltl TaxID=8319 RepID=A0AAV7TUR2_PLEWA|nr:hypothetical protein NDU88_005603 [Pleurodeles waltl]
MRGAARAPGGLPACLCLCLPGWLGYFPWPLATGVLPRRWEEVHPSFLSGNTISAIDAESHYFQIPDDNAEKENCVR